MAVADVVASTGVAADGVSVTRNEEVTWRDGSLGCEQKGMAAITVLTPGHLIVLSAGGKSYEYHSGVGKPPFRCDNPQPPLPPGSTGT